MGSALDVRRESVQEVLRLAENFASEAEFPMLCLRAQEVLELTDLEFADGVSVSRPTFNRWKNGRNLPHPIGQGAVARWIRAQVLEKVKRLDALERGRRGNSGSGAITRYALAAKSSR